MTSPISSSPLLLSSVILLLASSLTSANFIIDICRPTTYPMVCYNSLSPYAEFIGDCQPRVVEIAVSSVLLKVRRFSSYLTQQNITKYTTCGDPHVVEALNFCVDNYNEVTVQFELANSIVHRRGQYNEEELRCLFGNDLGRSLSSALAQEIECNDAWKNAADSPMKADIWKRSLNLAKFTQNAKDLLAAYAKTFQSQPV